MTVAPSTVMVQARSLASASLWSLSGSLLGRALGLATTWILAGALKTHAFGLYTLGATLILLGSSLGTGGGDSGAAHFTAKHREDPVPSPLLGMLRGSILLCVLGSLLVASTSWGIAIFHPDPETRLVAGWVGAGIVAGSLASVAASTLVGGRDLRGYFTVQQVGKPLLTLLGCGGAMALGWGVQGALGAFVLARVATGIGGGLRVKHLLGARLKREPSRATDWPTLLAFSLPQSLTPLMHRALLSVDLLMLAALASLSDVGVYRVALSLALFGTIPLIAANSVFGPRAARWLHKEELEILGQELHRMTRWLVLLATPLFLAVLFLPDLWVQLFSQDYHRAAPVLAILIAGRALQVVLEPAGACLVQGGHAGLNLCVGVGAMILNLVLNGIWIPRWGISGAALGSSIALAAWSVGRAVMVWHFHGVTPISRSNLTVLSFLAVLSITTWTGMDGHSLPLRMAVAPALIGLVTWSAWRWTADETDRVLLRGVAHRFGIEG